MNEETIQIQNDQTISASKFGACRSGTPEVFNGNLNDYGKELILQSNDTH